MEFIRTYIFRQAQNEWGKSLIKQLRAQNDRKHEGFAIMRIEIKHDEASVLPQTNVLKQLKMMLQQIECAQPEHQRYKHITTENSEKFFAHNLPHFACLFHKASRLTTISIALGCYRSFASM